MSDEEELYDVYEIISYSSANNDFIKNNVKKYTLNKLLMKLKSNNGYHIRIDPEKYYTFFGDIDGHKQKSTDFFNFMIKFLKDFYEIYDIEIVDISYTKNSLKEGSYHYSIPKIYSDCKKMKEIVANMKIEYDKIYGKEQNKVIDTSIYSKHWFRMPNQTKEGVVGSEHIVVRGKLVDFVVEYIDDNALNISNAKYKKTVVNDKEIIVKDDIDHDKLKKTEFLESEIIKFVGLLSMKRCNEYQDWLNVGICLKNINNDYLHIWTEWSKKGNDYEDGCCTKKWKTFGKSDSGKKLTIGSLIKWVQNDNPKKFKEVWAEHNVNRIIKLQKKNFPNNNLEIAKIIQNDEQTYIKLKDDFCPINKKPHNEKSSRSVEIYKSGDLTMKCSHQNCEGKIFPCNHIKLNTKDAKTVFNTLVVNNYYNDLENVKFDKLDIFEDKTLCTKMLNALNIPNDTNISKIIFYLFKDRYIYDVNTYYEFTNHKWKKIEEDTFKKVVFDKLESLYDKILETYKNEDEKVVNYIRKQFKDIGNSGTKTNILKETKTLFNYVCRKEIKNDWFYNDDNESFSKKLNKNPYLLGFKNGIYDLKKNEFRDGKPDDYVSFCVGYNYVATYSDKIDEIKKFFKDIQPEKEQREFLLTFLGSCLVGTAKDEIYTIFTGIKRNGKTTCVELLNLVLGDNYYGTIDTSFLTGTRPDSNLAQPDMVDLQDARVVTTSENEAGKKLNTGHIKKLTGRDLIKFRQLYSAEMIKMKPQFKLISLFNDIPEVDHLDGAFWSRCKVLFFPITFVKNPKNKNEKLIDVDLKEKIIEWKQDFMLLLIEYCQDYLKNGLTFPEGVEEQTKIYKSSVDSYEKFVDECLDENEKDAVCWTELRQIFINWYKENIGDKVPDAKEIKKYFIKKFNGNDKKCRDINNRQIRGWKGWSISNQTNDDSE